MKFLERHGDWIRWGLVLCAIFATQYFDGRFVAKTVYEAEKKETRGDLDGLKAAMATTSTAIALLQQARQIEDDHEQRLRMLERRGNSKTATAYENSIHSGMVSDFGGARADK